MIGLFQRQINKLAVMCLTHLYLKQTFQKYTTVIARSTFTHVRCSVFTHADDLGSSLEGAVAAAASGFSSADFFLLGLFLGFPA